MANTNVKAVITAEDRSGAVLKGFANSVDSVSSKIKSSLKVASVAFATATVASAGFAIKSSAEFEQTRIGLENMLGGADKARQVLADVSKFASATPFEFPELAGSVKQLIAFGFNAEDAIGTMKQLGDVSSAIGAPIGDLSYLMGTLRTQGRAFTIDLRQFASRGIPIYEYLAKVLKVDTTQINDLVEAGKIGFPEVQKAFSMMTSEGGKFYGSMAKQSKSLSGLFSTLKDNIMQTGRELVGITQEGDIKAGSLFDRLRNGTAFIVDNLPKAILAVQSVVSDMLPTLIQWKNNIVDVAKQVGDYLNPKLQALWNTVKNDLVPALEKFWKEILEPMMPVLGQVFVGAIGLAIDALNGLITATSSIIGFMAEHKTAVEVLAIAFGTLATAMTLNTIFTALTVGFTTLTTTTIPAVISSFTAMGLALPVTAIVAGVAIILFELSKIYDAYQDIQRINAEVADEQNSINVNIDQMLKKQGASANLYKIQQSSGYTGQSRLYDQNGVVTGGYAEGGFTGRGGENDVAGIVHKGEYVVPQSQVDQTTGMPKIGGQNTVNITVQAGAFMGSKQDAREYARLIMEAMRDVASSKNMSIQEMMG
ncbi:hypothetical protein UFOVP585_43 [uncultured Caudovirales phage]|uniref:Tape measure protein N-terminal domain-containing protein n=1 Tax=uncultured Caudovirales phage TaxID=2100421 RepID=A0A6J5MX95_9CAUD|nr:hypothetical protein UFOVP585_43 [uncultured Caudovirales phage]